MEPETTEALWWGYNVKDAPTAWFWDGTNSWFTKPEEDFKIFHVSHFVPSFMDKYYHRIPDPRGQGAVTSQSSLLDHLLADVP